MTSGHPAIPLQAIASPDRAVQAIASPDRPVLRVGYASIGCSTVSPFTREAQLLRSTTMAGPALQITLSWTPAGAHN
ncbi:hypothetical protein E6O75_ATG01725 [Venturia nashicola]|uniref:Uncharacterized protein n=1 Tax=Venturia nashicola TaxID=86259 RepID=A0A4Z1NE59_9PEZI|nr:hypothetical protein E6O75_ATG01725 [Venturia nashicola]